MAFTNWKELKKIDAHIHILPDAVHKANPDSEDAWLCTELHQYSSMMDELQIEKAIIMPLNDPWLMSMEFTVDAVHQNLWAMKKEYPRLLGYHSYERHQLWRNERKIEF